MTITPRFEANIGADISKFMQKANEVDAKIREMATGVIIDITAQIQDFMSDVDTVQSTINNIDRTVDVTVNGNITDLERAITEAHAQISALNDSATVNINGNDSNFNNAVENVNRTTSNLSRRVTQARIGADIGDFERRMVDVARALTEADDTVTPQIELEMTNFTRDIIEVQDRMREVARTTADPQVEADIAGFMAQMAAVQAQLEVVTREHDVDIRVDAGGASARLAALWLQIKALTAKDFIVGIQARWANYQAIMGAMAAFSRNFSEIAGMVGRGLTIAISPAIVPVLASVIGLLGNLGPMLGTIAGSSFALVGAFAAAGIGVAGFAAVAIPSIGGVIKTSKELKDIEEKIAAADTWKEKNKLMQEQQAILDGMSKSQIAAGDALNTFKSNYAELVKAMEAPVLNVFSSGLTAITGLLALARPMIRNATDAMGFLMDALNRNLESQDVKDFFTFLAKSAGPALLTVGKAVGNFMMGLFNMFTAFAPLSVDTQNGFLAMSESFRTWAAGLSESKKFQAFVDYTKENMPKIRSIFSDAIQGMINMFGGFSGSSSDMMTSLQNLMERFKNWSATISENQGFQKFLDYFKTNGPVVVSAIAEIVKLITNFGIAAAPIGAWLLDLIISFVSWSNSMMKAHPWLGKVAVGAVVLTGAFLAALPVLVGINALTGGFITTLLRMAATWTIAAAKMAAGWLVAMGPIGWVIIAVAALAIIIYKYWDEISAWTSKAWTAVSTAAIGAIDKIMLWIQTKFPAVYTIIQAYMTMVKEVISAALNFIKGTFSNVLSYLKALVKGDFEGMKNAVTNQMELIKSTISRIWNAVKSYITTALSAVLSVVITKFAQIVSSVRDKMSNAKESVNAKWTEIIAASAAKLANLLTTVITFFARVVMKVREKMGEAVRAVGEFIGQMPGKVLSFVGQMISAGASLVGGVIEGIKSKISEGLGVIGGLATSLISRFKSDTDTHSPSRAFKNIAKWFAPGIVAGIHQTSGQAFRAITNLSSGLTNAFNPAFDMADMRASAQLDTSINRADMGVVRKSFAAEIGELERHEPDLYLVVDGRELGKVVAQPVQEENDRRGAMLKVGRGR
ncbi:hypothetical protein [Planococcus koreensis]|uniref:hypothetical protein n=1 Tax=Planococcus koreensis TaxID=112331 RepID=UPI0039FBC2D8